MLFFGVCVLILSGCSPKVGGECVYGKEIKGTALVKSIENGECIVEFHPESRVLAEWSVEKKFRNIDAKCYGKVEKGMVYGAVYRQEIRGSCKPYRLAVYTEEFFKKHPNRFQISYNTKRDPIKKSK